MHYKLRFPLQQGLLSDVGSSRWFFHGPPGTVTYPLSDDTRRGGMETQIATLRVVQFRARRQTALSKGDNLDRCPDSTSSWFTYDRKFAGLMVRPMVRR